jgi:hypothetical protein
MEAAMLLNRLDGMLARACTWGAGQCYRLWSLLLRTAGSAKDRQFARVYRARKGPTPW